MNDMGRKAKMRLDYFPMDVDIFQDLKIRKLIKRQGGKANNSIYSPALLYLQEWVLHEVGFRPAFHLFGANGL